MKCVKISVQLASFLAAALGVISTGVAQSGQGGRYLLVSDYDGNCVRRYDMATGAFVDTFIARHSGGLNQPQGLVFGPHDGNLYVASGELSGSAQRRAILRFEGASGTFLDEFAGGGLPPSDAHTTHLRAPHAVVFGPDGHVYVADGFVAATAKVIRYHGATGEFIDDFVPANGGGLEGPMALVFGPSGRRGFGILDLYVSNARNNSVIRYNGTTGDPLGEFVIPGSGGLNFPIGLAFGPDGNLYVLSSGFTSDGASAVLRFQGPSGSSPGDPMPSPGNSGAVFVASGSGGLLTSFGLIFGPDGNGDGHHDLYLPSFDLVGSNKSREKSATIKRYDGVTGTFIDDFITANSGGLDQPNYLTFTETDPVTLEYLGN